MSPTELQHRRIDLVVARFVSTDHDLQTILQATPDPLSPLAQAMLYIQECLNGRRLAKDAILAAEAVPMEGVSSEMLILMLSGWAELACRILRPSHAETLVQRAKALLTPNTPTEIRATAMRAEGLLADALGDKQRHEKLLMDILKILSLSSPRRKFFAWETALYLAQQGRLVEFDSEMRWLSHQITDHFKPERLSVASFFNALETGQAVEAAELLPRVQANPALLRTFLRDAFSGYEALLQLIAGTPETRGPAPDPHPAAAVPLWIRTARALLRNDPQEALRFARLEANKLVGSIFAGGFSAFSLIRAELAAGNGEAARRLLDLRHAGGNHHYLDDSFLARVHLLAGDRRKAARHLESILESVAFYHARGRLDLELRMACEMSPVNWIEILRPASHGSRRRRSSAPRPTTVSRRTALAHPPDAVNRLIGQSREILQVRELVERFAESDMPVLITGETGTGKELVARALYQSGKRQALPFVAVNCGSIAETILESELFGHERGAFTGADRSTQGLFEEAGTGTIFLDEIGEIPPRLQSALLRVLETGEIRAVGSAKTRKTSCRILAATNADLPRLADEGKFRKDLLFRLQRLDIHIPPLRERRNDILLLARHFLDLGRRPGIHASMSDDFARRLTAYGWPGNVRELKNVIERMRLMHSDKLTYTPDDLDLKFHTGNVAAALPHVAFVEPSSHARDGHHGENALASTPGAQAPASEWLRDGHSPLRRLDRIRALFREHGKLTRGELVRILGVAPNTATKDLKALCEEGLVERVEPSSSTRSHYFVLKGQAPD